MNKLRKIVFAVLIVLLVASLLNTSLAVEGVTDDNKWYVFGDYYYEVGGVYNAPHQYDYRLTLPSQIQFRDLSREVTGTSNLAPAGYRFSEMPNLTTVVVPNPINYIDRNLFEGLSKLTTVNLGSAVKTIHNQAFNNCPVLRDVTFAAGSALEFIGDAAFAFDPKLTYITLPDTVNHIGQGAFKNTGLVSFRVPASVTTLKSNTFYGCTNLTSIYIPTSVTTIEANCFAGVTNLVVTYAGTQSQWNSISKGSGNTFQEVIPLRTDPVPETPTVPQATFQSISTSATPYTTNAYLKATATASGSGRWSQYGVRVYRNGTQIASKDVTCNYEQSSLSIQYNMTNQLGVTLSEGTQYSYQFYADFNGTRHWSSSKTFTTGVTPSLTFTNWLEEVTDAYFIFSFDANANMRGVFTEYGFVLREADTNTVMRELTVTDDPNLNVSGAQYLKIHSWKPMAGLKPATTYTYQLHYVFNGQRFDSMIYTVRTTDTSVPTLGAPVISNITKNGYDISISAHDNSKIARVCFPTRKEDEGWPGVWDDDDVWNGVLTTTSTMYGESVTATYHVTIPENIFSYDRNWITAIFAYDSAGNISEMEYISTYIDGTSPTISPITEATDCRVVNNLDMTLRVSATDPSGISYYRLLVWPDSSNADNGVSRTYYTSANTVELSFDLSVFGLNQSTRFCYNVEVVDIMGNYNYEAGDFFTDYDPPEVYITDVSTASGDAFRISAAIYDNSRTIEDCGWFRVTVWDKDEDESTGIVRDYSRDELASRFYHDYNNCLDVELDFDFSNLVREVSTEYNIRASVMDPMGNIGSDTIVTYVDRVAPVIHEYSYRTMNSQGFVLKAVASDDSYISGAQVTVSCGNTTRTYDTLYSNYSVTAGRCLEFLVKLSDFGGARDTSYSCALEVYDVYGNSTGDTLSVYVPAPDTTAPVISDVSVTWGITSGQLSIPVNGQDTSGGMQEIYWSGYFPKVTFTVSDDEEIAAVYTPNWSLPNGQDDLTPHYTNAAWKDLYRCYIKTIKADGTTNVYKERTFSKRIYPMMHNDERGCDYVFRIIAEDTSGNESTMDVLVYMPELPMEQEVTWSIAGDGTELNEVTFNWAPDGNAGIYSLYLYSPETGDSYYAVCEGGSVTTAKLLLPAGSYSGSLTSVNLDGNYAINTDDSIEVTVPAGTPEEGSMVAQKEGCQKLYRVYASSTTWMGACVIADQNPGRLAIIDDADKQSVVSGLVAQAGVNAWIGARYVSHNWLNPQRCCWGWSGGGRVYYSNWELGQPKTATNIMKCVQITHEGYWRAIENNETIENGGYIMEYDPTAVTATLTNDVFASGRLPGKDDFRVIVTFEDGTVLATKDYDFTLSGSNAGAQTVTITYGDYTVTLPITLVEPMENPDFILPTGLKRIEYEAFEGGNMTCVQLPEGLERIDARAFANCRSLRAVYIPDSVVCISFGAFAGCTQNLTVYGRSGSLAQTWAQNEGITFVPTS